MAYRVQNVAFLFMNLTKVFLVSPVAVLFMDSADRSCGYHFFPMENN